MSREGRKRNRRSNPGPRPTRSGRWTPRRVLKWLGGTLAAALAAVVIAAVTGIPGQILDGPKVKDALRDYDAQALVKGLRRGDALQLTVLDLTTLHGWAAAFPADRVAAAQQFLDQRAWPEDIGDFFRRELDAGGYAIGSLVVELEVEGKRNQEITIYDIRPLVRPAPIPVGAAVRIASEGDTTRQMVFDLDTPAPIAKAIPDGMDGLGALTDTATSPFFRTQRIGLPDGHKETLALTFVAVRGAYEFTLAIDYELGGQKFTQTVTLSGAPFRVAADLCTLPGVAERLSDADRKQLAGLRYGQVTTRERYAVPYRLTAMDPALLCEHEHHR